MRCKRREPFKKLGEEEVGNHEYEENEHATQNKQLGQDSVGVASLHQSLKLESITTSMTERSRALTES